MAIVQAITPTKFLRYQEAFHKEASSSPLKCTLIITGKTSTDAFSDFVGDNTRTEEIHDIPILWERSLESINRSKYGIEQGRDSTMFISPKTLERHLGTFRIDARTTKVRFLGRDWIVDKVDFLSPLYNSCIAVEIHLQSATKGGQ